MNDDLSFWRNSEKVNKQIIQHFSFLGLSVWPHRGKNSLCDTKNAKFNWSLVGMNAFQPRFLFISFFQLFFTLWTTTTHQTSFYILTAWSNQTFKSFGSFTIHTHTQTHARAPNYRMKINKSKEIKSKEWSKKWKQIHYSCGTTNRAYSFNVLI